jgi:hypothetical protein
VVVAVDAVTIGSALLLVRERTNPTEVTLPVMAVTIKDTGQ